MGDALGARMRELRVGASLTLESLSGQAGVSARTIGNIERGAIAAPQHHTLAALLNALKVDDDVRAELLRLATDARLRPSADRATVLTPPYVSDFVGRTEQLSALGRLLDPAWTDRRPIGISGPAGVGKTSTALEALRRVHRSPAKQLFVDLAGMSDAPLTPLQVLQSLLMQVTGSAPVPTAFDDAVLQWQAATRAQPLTVLLDDARYEAQIRPALACGTELQVVVTGRRPLLGLEDFPRMALGPLHRSESVHLLARIVPPAQRQTGDLDDLAAASGDLPLALRIAGNRIAARPALHVQDFVAHQRRADAPLDAFVAGDQAVQTSLLRSVDQLDVTARTVFRSLSALEAEPFDAAHVAAAAALGPDVATRAMDDLVELGLVLEHGSGRYSLHRLVRHLAAQLAQQADDVDAVRRRARAWLLQRAERVPGAASAWRAGDRRRSDAQGDLEAESRAADAAWIRDRLRALRTPGAAETVPLATRRQHGSVESLALAAASVLPPAGSAPSTIGSEALGA